MIYACRLYRDDPDFMPTVQVDRRCLSLTRFDSPLILQQRVVHTVDASLRRHIESCRGYVDKSATDE